MLYKKFLKILSTLLIFTISLFGQAITFSEVMFNPEGSEYYDEFIEIANISDSTVHLSGAYLEVSGSKADTLDFIDGNDSLLANSYAVILDRGYLIDGKSDIYDDLIPDSVLLLTIQDAAFGTNGLSNSESNTIYLFSHSGDTLSTVYTTPDQDEGYSDEKIIIDGPNTPENWGNSISLYGTPGFRNSIFPKDYDMEVTSFEILTPQEQIEVGEFVRVQLTVKNIGLLTCEDVEILFGADADKDSILGSEEISYALTDSVPSGDSLNLSPSIEVLSSGYTNLIAQINFSKDEHLENNIKHLELAVPYSEYCLAINEFMHYPEDESGGEWVEFFNISNDTLNLKNWAIADKSNEVLLTDNSFILPPERFAVVAKDSSFLDFWDVDSYFVECSNLPSLNNDSDSIIIRDHTGKCIDQVGYDRSWGYAEGISLERENPYTNSSDSQNWGLSIAEFGGTPGTKNSIMPKDYDLSVDSVTASSYKDSLIIGDSAQIQIAISNIGLNEISNFQIQLEMFKPNLQYENGLIIDTTIYIYESISPSESSLQDIDIYSILGGVSWIVGSVISEQDENSLNNSDTCKFSVGYPRNSLVINEIMYSPDVDDPEWFEIFNISNYPIDLNVWQFRDANGNWQVLIDTTYYILENGFVIVAKNRDFLLRYPDFAGAVIFPLAFPTLNNVSDSLFLNDATGHLIEGIYYRSDWGGESGVSLERRNPNDSPYKADNWGSSVSTDGSTPGLPNSILKYYYDLSITPKSFLLGDTITTPNSSINFELKVKNTGRLETEKFSVFIYNDRNYDSTASPQEVVLSSHNIPSLQPDSSRIIRGNIFSEGSGLSSYLAFVEMSKDEDVDNNSAYADLRVSFAPNSLVINEFLPYPLDEQVEFIEFYNNSSEVVDLWGWKLHNKRTSVTVNSHIYINPKGYLILSGDSLFFNLLSSSGAMVFIPDKWPGLNNTADRIVLEDLTGVIIDSLRYDDSWNVYPGVSFEKILQYLPSNDLYSWLFCINEGGTTAGFLNSITPFLYDLSLDSLKISYAMGDTATIFPITFFISNCGQLASSEASIDVYIDDSGQMIKEKSAVVDALETGESDSILCNIGPFPSGIHDLFAIINWGEDENAQNDSLNLLIKISFPRESVLLSEFMPAPYTIQESGISTAEYLEIYNAYDRDIFINDWYISDNNTAKPVKIQFQYPLLQDSLLVIASDSSIFNFPGITSRNTVILQNFPLLSNTEDALFIFDPTMKVIDSLTYGSTWDIVEGISFERVSYNNSNSHTNWRSSVSACGGTPGLINSVYITSPLAKPGVKAYPNPFSPNSDGVDDEVAFQYQLPFPHAKVTIEIYDLAGRLIACPARDILSSSEGAIYWGGESEYGDKARIGMYVVRCTATDTATNRVETYITTVVLARR